ncbi:hypothetical protein Ppa06_64710 [Planomonospora parontospora subsp. parontospora]|uniref:Uncharacterized protein n=2 Tax=Planomonospora parontospora TaxID=58119 RepID=A0AA37F7N7_9ACTN|nr:hypothetical protein [Planomonospora parontospora]GGK94311.1 hypothetical protein GCM10010126_62170 [Planomonospora parontospora]GII12673.1 hypothetical protein Ppa06_64710 [Planomonospora parontospora subsp. parontospora]
MNHHPAPAPTPEVLHQERALHRRIRRALALALAGDHRTERAAKAIGVHHGRAGLVIAMLHWTLALCEHTPSGLHPVEVLLPNGPAAPGLPVTSEIAEWAADLIQARLDDDRAAFDALLEVPDGPAAVRDHVMGLLTLIAAAARPARRGRQEQPATDVLDVLTLADLGTAMEAITGTVHHPDLPPG